MKIYSMYFLPAGMQVETDEGIFQIDLMPTKRIRTAIERQVYFIKNKRYPPGKKRPRDKRTKAEKLDAMFGKLQPYERNVTE